MRRRRRKDEIDLDEFDFGYGGDDVRGNEEEDIDLGYSDDEDELNGVNYTGTGGTEEEYGDFFSDEFFSLEEDTISDVDGLNFQDSNFSNDSHESFDSLDDDFGNEIDFGEGTEGSLKEESPRGSNTKNSKDGIFHKLLDNSYINKLLDLVGVNRESMLGRIIKLITSILFILLLIILIIAFFIKLLFGNGAKNDGVQIADTGDSKSFLSFIGKEDEVTVEESYSKKHIKKVSETVSNYKEPTLLEGITFKIFEVEPHDLGNGKTYYKVSFGIKNEGDKVIKFNEYDFSLYNKEGLELKKDKLGKDIKTVKAEESLGTKRGLEPVILKTGNNTTTLGKGEVKPDEVYSSYVVFGVDVSVEDLEGLVMMFNPRGLKGDIYSKIG